MIPSSWARCLAAALAALISMGAPATSGEVNVFAAASLQPALDPIATAWRVVSGHDARLTYAGTPALAKQIEQGAPADVFISADTEWMGYLEAKGLIREGTRADRIGNRLVLIAPVASARASIELQPGVDLTAVIGDGRLAMGDPASVPAGRYGKAALESLGLWRSVADRLAPTENVRQALAYVARGEAPLGIVYASDARSEPAVRVLAVFPEKSHPPIVYPAAIVASSANPAAAEFLDYVHSESSQRLFAAAGYRMIAPPDVN